jgi:phosphoglycerate dehydrogenase-like enzyme
MEVLVPYGDALAQSIQEILGDEAKVVRSRRTAEAMLENGRNAAVIASGRVPGDFIRNAPKLKMIQCFGAGVDKIDHEAVLERSDIIVCNSRINSEEVAEYAIALLLSLAKNVVQSDGELRKGSWKYGWGGERPNIELRAKKCLILGLGRIGSAIAQRLDAFGMTLYAATRSGESSLFATIEDTVTPREMEPLVREADFVILSLPLTADTEGLVDNEFLSWMKPTSLLVNVARGSIVDEAALYEALSTQRIAGAAIDVWWRYPPKFRDDDFHPSEFPFHELKNVIMSPHRAAYSEKTERDQIKFAGENILRFVRGETPLNVVDMKRGY